MKITPAASFHAPSRPQRPRLPGLDLLRAVAIGWVLIYHASNTDLVPDPDHWIFQFGWMGVDIFFVLSGFLIASQLLRPFARGEKPNYGRFCFRRLTRTLPAYIAILAIYFVVPSAREQPAIQPLWQFLTFTENLFIDLSQPKSFSHVWSLCVEEQFYAIFPIAVALLARRANTRVIVQLLIAMIVGGMIIRGYLWMSLVSSVQFDTSGDPQFQPYMTMIYYPTWSRLDGLLAGISVAAIKVFRPLWWGRLTARPNLLLLLSAAGISISVLWFGRQTAPFLPTVFAFPLLAWSLALAVVAACDERSLIGRHKVPGAGALASGAYSLYLTQKIAFHLIASSSLPEGWLRFVAALTLALIFGTLLYWTIERPFLKLRDRLDGRPHVPSVS